MSLNREYSLVANAAYDFEVATFDDVADKSKARSNAHSYNQIMMEAGSCVLHLLNGIARISKEHENIAESAAGALGGNWYSSIKVDQVLNHILNAQDDLNDMWNSGILSKGFFENREAVLRACKMNIEAARSRMLDTLNAVKKIKMADRILPDPVVITANISLRQTMLKDIETEIWITQDSVEFTLKDESLKNINYVRGGICPVSQLDDWLAGCFTNRLETLKNELLRLDDFREVQDILLAAEERGETTLNKVEAAA